MGMVSPALSRDSLRGRADGHEHGRDGAALPVPIADRQGDPLAARVGHDDDELAGLALAGDLWGLDFEDMDVGHQPFAADDAGHQRTLLVLA